MLVPYSFEDSGRHYKDYYLNQIGGNGISVYSGSRLQKGHGIGNFFSSMLRGAMPLIKSGAKTIGRQALKAGWNIARDAISGRDVKSSARRNLTTAGDNLVGRLVETLDSPPSASAKGRSRKRKKRTRTMKGNGGAKKRKRATFKLVSNRGRKRAHKRKRPSKKSDICSRMLVL